MEFKVRNYRGISSADIELSKLTLICGNNGAGKTSLIDAIRSVAIGAFNPFKDITKKEISMFVRSGTASGYAEIIDGENVSRIGWPKCDYSTKGKAVIVSEVASGIRSLVNMTSPDRINYIIKMMSAAPTETDLITELKSSKIFKSDTTIGTTNFFKRLWNEIVNNGWDNAYKLAKEKGIKFKGLWEDRTGIKKYGIRIAEAWQPEKWTPDLEKISEVDLIADVNQAKEWVEAALKDTAISDHEIERLTCISANIDGMKKKLDTLLKQQTVLENEIINKKKRIRNIKSGEEIHGLVCPKCKSTLTLTDGVLKILPKAQHLKAGKEKAEIVQLEKDIASLEIQNKETIAAWGQEKTALKVAKDAALKLKNIEIKKTGDVEASIENVKNKLVIAEDRLQAYRDFVAGHKIAKDIILNQELCAILAPAGLRNKMLTKALKRLNNTMKILTDSAGWEPVELNENCDVIVSGVPYGRFIAKSERYRARVLLQLMVAMAEKASFVIIDDADEVTSSIRSKLMNVILKSTINAIVVCALDSRDKMPDLSPINGRTYWIEKGMVK